MFASVSARVWAAPAFVCLKIVHARICSGFCVLQQKIHTGVIQNRNYVPCYGCSSVIFPLIKRAVHRTLASAFSISPWSREEMVSVHLSVFIHFFFGLATRRHSAYLRSFFSSLWAFYSPKWMVTIFPAFVHISFSRWNSTDILLLTACSRHNQPTSDSRNVKTLNCPLFSRLGENDGE